MPWPALRLAGILTDNMPIPDPKTNKVSFFKMPVAIPNAGVIRSDMLKREAVGAVGLLGR